MTPLQIGTTALSAVQAGIIDTYSDYLPAVIAFLVALYPLKLFVGFVLSKLGRGKIARG